MTQQWAGKNYKELTIKIYVDARPMKDRTSQPQFCQGLDWAELRPGGVSIDSNHACLITGDLGLCGAAHLQSLPPSQPERGKNLSSWKAQGSFEKVYYAHLSPSSDSGLGLAVYLLYK